MSEPTNGAFPWLDFASWLGEALLAATIMNKFMIAAWPEGSRPATQPLDVRGEELEFLKTIAEGDIPTEYKQVINGVVADLSGQSKYPETSEQSILQLWEAMRAYATTGDQQSELKNELETFIEIQDSPESLASNLIDHIWRSLGPATAPDQGMIYAEDTNS